MKEQAKVLADLIWKTNSSLSNDEVDQIVGEVIIGRQFRASDCQICGGRGKIIAYPEGMAKDEIVSPVWKTCKCSMPKAVEEIESPFASLFPSIQKAFQQLEILQLESQQIRQVSIEAENAVKNLQKRITILSSLLRRSCILLQRSVPLLNKDNESASLLLSEVGKFMSDKEL
jgi:hypothetical protein